MEQEQRCKNCGAPLTLTNHSRTVECDHCGSVFELDDNRAQFVNLYAQADDAWSRKDFDEAMDICRAAEDALVERNLKVKAYKGK